MIPILNLKDLAEEQILNRDIRAEENVSTAVDAVIDNVRKNGDTALLEYTETFDGVKLEELQVSDEEIVRAMMQASPALVDTLRQAAANIEAFHRAQIRQDVVLTEFLPISARFIANKASYAFKKQALTTLLEKLQEVIG